VGSEKIREEDEIRFSLPLPAESTENYMAETVFFAGNAIPGSVLRPRAQSMRSGYIWDDFTVGELEKREAAS
jgi:hypothetical protein